MDLFISWSGERSRLVALALRDWLPNVLQSVLPYVSSEDIEKGARWSTDIARRLEDSSFGIVCVTKDNVSASWLNFEAGALAKSFDTSRVSPFLLDLSPADISGPLAQFQATQATVADITRLVRSINASTASPLDESRLISTVELWWPRLEESLKAIPGSTRPPDELARPEGAVLAEILGLVRNSQFRLNALEDYMRSYGRMRDTHQWGSWSTHDDTDTSHVEKFSDDVLAIVKNQGVAFHRISYGSDLTVNIVPRGKLSSARRARLNESLLAIGARSVIFEDAEPE